MKSVIFTCTQVRGIYTAVYILVHTSTGAGHGTTVYGQYYEIWDYDTRVLEYLGTMPGCVSVLLQYLGTSVRLVY